MEKTVYNVNIPRTVFLLSGNYNETAERNREGKQVQKHEYGSDPQGGRIAREILRSALVINS